MSDTIPDDALPPDPSRRALVVWFTPETNEIDIDADPRLSCFDICGLLSHAIDMAVNWLPVHDNEYAPEGEEEESE